MSIFCSFMSRIISCEWNGGSMFAYDLESSPSLSHLGSCVDDNLARVLVLP